MTGRRARDRGFPTSSNGASSFHLWWQGVPRCDALEVSITVDHRPKVERLCFWALQASFVDGSRRTGGGHLGLQWNPRFPGFRAVNWGGYAAKGGILRGTRSPLRSTPDDPNTRDLWWEPGTTYRLRIALAEPGWWSGSIEDDRGNIVEVRKLEGGGSQLVSPVVWSEIFARCDDPQVSVTWANPGFERAGEMHTPTHYEVNYQDVDRGGCTNTSAIAIEGGVRQITNTARITAQGTTLPVGGRRLDSGG